MSDADLRSRFERLWHRLGATGDPGSACGDLLRAYAEPHRHYHDLRHLSDCLRQLDDAPDFGADRDLAEAALWFHDVVYQPGVSDNESASAEWAGRALGAGAVAEKRIQEVARLVRLTDHAAPAEDELGIVVCDVDLSILGRTPEEFDRYERDIRREYGQVPEPAYRSGRRAVLSRLTARDTIYGSRHFHARHEEAARRNLERSLARLDERWQA